MANSLVNLVDHHPHILDDWKQIIKKNVSSRIQSDYV